MDATTNLPLAGVHVTAVRQGPPPASQSIRTAADGSFTMGNLPVGTYSLCAQTPLPYVDPCRWTSGKAPTATLTAGQRAAGVLIALKPGSVLRVRLQDPNRLLDQKTREGRAHHLAVGVWGPNNLFYPASLASRDAAGAEYSLTVPRGSALCPKYWLVRRPGQDHVQPLRGSICLYY